MTRLVYKALTLGSENVSPHARIIDDKVGYAVNRDRHPSAFLLHGYVGFIFGSVKANPWWSHAADAIVFLFSAMVSGIAAVMLLYMASMKCARRPSTCAAWTPSPSTVLYLRDRFSLEMLDLVHRTYEATNPSAAWISWCTRAVVLAGDFCKSCWARWSRWRCWRLRTSQVLGGRRRGMYLRPPADHGGHFSPCAGMW